MTRPKITGIPAPQVPDPPVPPGHPGPPPVVRHRAPAAAALALLLLAGCTVGPDYEPPEVGTGDGWTEAAAPAVGADGPAEAVDLGSWWTVFGDPVLDRLMDEALADNLELAEAAARIAEARALRDAVTGRAAPTLRAEGSVAHQRLAEDGFFPVERIPGFDRDQTIYDVGFDASWEPDLFGRTERAVEAAEARLEETVERHRGVQTAVAAEVARTYLELRGAQQRLAALEDAVEAARRTAELVTLQVEVGEVAEAELVRARGDLVALEARVPPLAAEVRADALSLGVLLGDLPETELGLAAAEPPANWAPASLPPLPVGQRADLLRRRPDVRAAERRLAAATAEIGVATAELFPRLSIGAGGGFQAMDLSGLGSSGSETWSLVPFLSWRLFDGGRVRAEIRATEARARIAALAYERTVKQALTDAERALTRYLHALDAVERQTAAVEVVGRGRELARLRYEAGEEPLFGLLDAERSLVRAQEELAADRTRASTLLVALFKALGGGWEAPAPPGEPA